MIRSTRSDQLRGALATVLLVTACARSGRESAARRDSSGSRGAPNVATVASPVLPKATDAQIRKAVIEELFHAPHTASGTILVACANGVVELTGSVDNLLARDRAVAVAESVRGVRSVSARLRIEPGLRPDTEIVRDVKNALAFDPAADGYQITVTASDGVVRLSGSVESFEERRLAEQLARGARGVKAVVNAVTVNFLKRREDLEIQRDIESRLRWDTFLDDRGIRVSVYDGNVQLSGNVASAVQKSQAYNSAWVHGVRNVDASGLDVDPWRTGTPNRQRFAERSDAEIAAAVEDGMRYDPRIKEFEVQVQVMRGGVTLAGEVGSRRASRAAESIARHTVGVTGVQNQLEVRKRPDVPDSTLQARIRAAIDATSSLDGDSIEVEVAQGRVTLTGRVQTLFDSAQAVDIAGTPEGVTEVTNELVAISSEVPYIWHPTKFPFGPYVEGGRFVAAAPAQSDAQIARNIQRELNESPLVEATNVQLSVKDGQATLRGTIEGDRARAAAEEAAYEGGAISVENQLSGSRT